MPTEQDFARQLTNSIRQAIQNYLDTPDRSLSRLVSAASCGHIYHPIRTSINSDAEFRDVYEITFVSGPVDLVARRAVISINYRTWTPTEGWNG